MHTLVHKVMYRTHTTSSLCTHTHAHTHTSMLLHTRTQWFAIRERALQGKKVRAAAATVALSLLRRVQCRYACPINLPLPLFSSLQNAISLLYLQDGNDGP